MMKFERLLVLSGLFCLLLLTACASQGGRQKATGSEVDAADIQPQSKARPETMVDGKPAANVVPGAYFAEEPEDDGSEEAPIARNINTDVIDLEAKRDPKAELKRRVVERWALLINGKADQAFDYLAPGYRSVLEREKYSRDMAGRPVRWFRATFDHDECLNEQSCEVVVLVDFRIRMSAGMGLTESFSLVREQWIAVDGVWYHLPPDAGH